MPRCASRFAELPPGEQAAVHARAAQWFAEHDLLEASALHALAAGERERAYELAEHSLYDSMLMRGRLGTVLDWLDRIPAAELDRRPRLLLAAAWGLSVSERHEEAGRLVARLLAQPGVDDALRCECALILGGAAVFADLPDRFAELHDPWAEAPPLREPMLLQVHANRSAWRTLLAGEPALARLRQQKAPRDDTGGAPSYLGSWGDFIVGLSYLWEGQAQLVESLLQPTLAAAESQLGRRDSFTAMLAALLAVGGVGAQPPAPTPRRCWPIGSTCSSAAACPRPCCSAFAPWRASPRPRAPSIARWSSSARCTPSARPARLPRLCVASLSDQVRMHARRHRAETCRELVQQIDAELDDPALPQGPLWRRSVAVLRHLAHGYSDIAAKAWRRALEPLARADEIAQQLKQGRLHIELLGLRALALDRCGEQALPLLREAIDLAQTYGLLRVFDDAHPALGDWVRDIGAAPPEALLARPADARRSTPPAARDAARGRVKSSLALTPKEREVLELLARSLSNKEIGLAIQVGEETIKWHMKNLFAKLDAGTRKQVVSRARILGPARARRLSPGAALGPGRSAGCAVPRRGPLLPPLRVGDAGRSRPLISGHPTRTRAVARRDDDPHFPSAGTRSGGRRRGVAGLDQGRAADLRDRRRAVAT